jgi:hypothetical protein
MRNTLIGAVLGAALLVIFVLGSVKREAAGSDGRPLLAWLPAAEAAPAECAVPPVGALAQEWVVRSSRCTDGACAKTHLGVGDRFRFDRDISGEASFSLDVINAATKARSARTVGYALRSDGVAGVKGPITLAHDPLDGSPLDLHYLIVDVRAYDANGDGTCRLTARVQVCTDEPGPGATSCGAKQHGGVIILDPP